MVLSRRINNVAIKKATSMPASAAYEAINISMSKNDTVIFVISSMIAINGISREWRMSACNRLMNPDGIVCRGQTRWSSKA